MQSLPTGIDLVLLPDYRNEGIHGSYSLYLVNGLSQLIEVDAALEKLGRFEPPVTDLLLPESKVQIGVISHMDLHGGAAVDVGVRWLPADGKLELTAERLQRIKPNHLVKSAESHLLFDWPVLRIPLWHKLPTPIDTSLADIGVPSSSKHRYAGKHPLLDKAAFPAEVDLHTEAMGLNTRGLTSFEIVSLQMRKCIGYTDQAVRHGMDVVYIIHGKGAGTLRDAVHKMLSGHPGVASYSVSHIPRYDGGATEVVLR